MGPHIKTGRKKTCFDFSPTTPHFSVQGMSLTALFKAALFHAFSSSASLRCCLKTSWNHSPLLLWTLSILDQHLMFMRLEFLIILVHSCTSWCVEISISLRYCVLILCVFCFTATYFALQFFVFLPPSGQFLWVNRSAFGGPWVLSPWLWGAQGPCSLDMAVFLHPKQSGQYTIRLVERDKPPLALFSTDTLPRITG